MAGNGRAIIRMVPVVPQHNQLISQHLMWLTETVSLSANGAFTSYCKYLRVHRLQTPHPAPVCWHAAASSTVIKLSRHRGNSAPFKRLLPPSPTNPLVPKNNNYTTILVNHKPPVPHDQRKGRRRFRSGGRTGPPAGTNHRQNSSALPFRPNWTYAGVELANDALTYRREGRVERRGSSGQLKYMHAGAHTVQYQCVQMAFLIPFANEIIIKKNPNKASKSSSSLFLLLFQCPNKEPAHNRQTLISLQNCCVTRVSLHNGIKRSSSKNK